MISKVISQTHPMKKLSPLLWGWLGGALGGGILFAGAMWLGDRLIPVSPNFGFSRFLQQTLLSTFSTGLFMIPGVILATILYFRFPTFRGIPSLIAACATGLLTFLILAIFYTEYTTTRFLFASIAMTGSVLFWWIATEGERGLPPPKKRCDSKTNNSPD